MENKIPSLLKINGFTRGINVYQITSYFLLITQLFFFSYIMIPSFPIYLQITSILYYLPTCTTMIAAFLATACDPTDEIILEERRCKLEGKPFDTDRFDYQCEFCEANVSEFSKHCRACNRCVRNFDHHCKWINNCVAEKNYKNFMVMIISLAVAESWFCINSLLFIIDYFSKDLDILTNTQDLHHEDQHKWKIYVVIIYGVLMSIFLILDLRLVFFHLYLIRNKMTTYDHIIKNRNKVMNDSLETRKNSKGKKTKARIAPLPLNGTINSPSQDEGRNFNFEIEVSNKLYASPNISKLVYVRNQTSEIEKGLSPDSFGQEQQLRRHTTGENENTQQHSLKSINYAVNGTQENNEVETPNNINLEHKKLTKLTTQEKRLEEILNQGKSKGHSQEKYQKKSKQANISSTKLTSQSILPEISSLQKKNTIYKVQSSSKDDNDDDDEAK